MAIKWMVKIRQTGKIPDWLIGFGLFFAIVLLVSYDTWYDYYVKDRTQYVSWESKYDYYPGLRPMIDEAMIDNKITENEWDKIDRATEIEKYKERKERYK